MPAGAPDMEAAEEAIVVESRNWRKQRVYIPNRRLSCNYIVLHQGK